MSIDQYCACLVLSGAGDALGYKQGDFEFCDSGITIHEEVKKLGGVENITVKLPEWNVSDDTVMHLATAEALVEHDKEQDNEKLFSLLARKYQLCMSDMSGRAPGFTCLAHVNSLKPDQPDGYRLPYNPRGGGCGAAMRSMCIGLRYWRAEDLDQLMAVSVESGRMTHHNPIGHLGSLVGALFTAYAIQGQPVHQWGADLMETLPKALEYIKNTGWCYEKNKEDWPKFETVWKDYLHKRGLSDGKSKPTFPESFGIKERDNFYSEIAVSPNGWPGACGLDAGIMAYDALLGAKDCWKELCSRAMFHKGDSDSTGVMAAAWFGAMYDFKQVPECNYKFLEYKDRLEHCAKKLYELSH